MISSLSAGLSPPMTSSSSSSLGCVASTRATSSFLRSPMGRLPARTVRPVLQMDDPELLHGHFARCFERIGAAERADHDVVHDAHLGERPHLLPGAGHAELAHGVGVQAVHAPCRRRRSPRGKADNSR